MKNIIALFAILFAAALQAAPNVTNTVLMVDQRGKLNVEGIASVEDVATNSVKVQIAEEKARAAQATARGVTNALQATVANIMSNNVVIYRSGFCDSFEPLVPWTDDDTLIIKEARWGTRTAASMAVEVDYCCTANLGTFKPTFMHHDTLVGGRDDFLQLDEANVSTPVFHPGSVTIADQTYSGYYTTTVTIPSPGLGNSYFLWNKLVGDTPGGDGATLDLPNGVTEGVTATVNWGDKRLTFTGGVLTGVQDGN